MTSLKDKLLKYVEAAYLHALPVENLDNGELEPPKDISDVAWIADRLLVLFKQEVMAALPEKLYLEDLDPEEKINRVEYAKFSLGYNQAISDMESRLKERLTAQPESGGDA